MTNVIAAVETHYLEASSSHDCDLAEACNDPLVVYFGKKETGMGGGCLEETGNTASWSRVACMCECTDYFGIEWAVRGAHVLPAETVSSLVDY